MIGGPIDVALLLTIPVEFAARRARRAKPGKQQAAKERVHLWRALQLMMFALAFGFWIVYADQTWEYVVLAAGAAVALLLSLWQIVQLKRTQRGPVRAT